MESSDHSEHAIKDIENSIENSVNDVLLSNNNSKCGKCNVCKILFWTGLIIFIIAIIIILIVRLKLY